MSYIRRYLRNPTIAGWAAFVIATAVLLTHYSTKYGLNVAPSRSGDELSYDIIGWNLSHGRGFSEGGYGPQFRGLYEQSESVPLKFPNADCEAVAYRPPLFPLILSVLNRTVGRQFWAVRVWNVMAMAGTAGLLVWYLVKTGRYAAAVAGFGLLLIVDARTRLYGRAILTEATATMLMSVVTLFMIYWYRTSGRRIPISLGFVFGTAILTRSMFVLWVPFVALAILLLPPKNGRSDRRWFLWTPAILHLAIVTLLLMPWGLRNITVLDRFMPMGTQGMMQLYAGFSDHAIANRGVWTLDAEWEIRDELNLKGLSHLETEVAVATRSRYRAIQWIAAHLGATARLGVWKVWQEYRPRSATAWLIAACAIVGAGTTLRQADTRVCLLLHIVNSLTIAATWSVEGRFVVPMLFSIHLLAAQGATWPLKKLYLGGIAGTTDSQIPSDRPNV